LTDPALELDRVLWRLFNEEEEVRTMEQVQLMRGCRCRPDHIRSVIGRFPAEERAEMADDAGEIHVDCEFCAKRYSLALASFTA
jgi:molecular chaperone Hsp33